MDPSEKHRRYRRADFKALCPLDDLSQEEVEILMKYGAWMNALMWKRIEAYTEAQNQFVLMCRGKRKAATGFEKLRKKYRTEVFYYKAVKEEKRLSVSSTPSYKEVRKLYEKLAKMDHKQSIDWMTSEGPWVDMSSEKQSQYTKRLICHYIYPLFKGVPGSFGSKYDKGQGPIE